MSSDFNSKSGRVLELYQYFLSGKIVNKKEMAEYYGVNARSIQRDIDTIRGFLSDQITQQGGLQNIQYDAKEKGYKLVTEELAHISSGEMLAICKILIESRAFSLKDLESLLKRLLGHCTAQKEQEEIEGYINNELFNYVEPAHPSAPVQMLWRLAKAIKEQKIIQISYVRTKGKKTVSRRLWPVGILFSEYYFYLMGVIDDPEKRSTFENPKDPFPTIYRLDRIRNIKVLDETYSIPYSERFQEGAYKNRVQYMFGGETQHIEFWYFGPSVEAVLDKLPTASITEESEGVYTVKAEVFGKGILMWLLSQGSKVQVISPKELKQSWIAEAEQILKREGVLQ